MANPQEITLLARIIFADLISNSEAQLKQMQELLNTYATENKQKLKAKKIADKITTALVEAIVTSLQDPEAGPNSLKALFDNQGIVFSAAALKDQETLDKLKEMVSLIALDIKKDNVLLPITTYIQNAILAMGATNEQELAKPELELEVKTQAELIAELSQAASAAAYNQDNDINLEVLAQAIRACKAAELDYKDCKDTFLAVVKQVLADTNESTTTFRNFVGDKFTAFTGPRVEQFTEILVTRFIQTADDSKKITTFADEANKAFTELLKNEELAKRQASEAPKLKVATKPEVDPVPKKTPSPHIKGANGELAKKLEKRLSLMEENVSVEEEAIPSKKAPIVPPRPQGVKVSAPPQPGAALLKLRESRVREAAAKKKQESMVTITEVSSRSAGQATSVLKNTKFY